MQKASRIKLRTVDGHKQLWDFVRKCWVACTPEELVRQRFIAFLIEDRKVPACQISVEYGFRFANGKPQRIDIVVWDNEGRPLLLVECKAPVVAIDRSVFDQVARYSAVIQAPYIAVTNGKTVYCCRQQPDGYCFYREFPSFTQMLK